MVKAAFIIGLMFLALVAYTPQEAQAATLRYDATQLNQQGADHLDAIGCYSKPSDQAEAFYCDVSYLVVLKDAETNELFAMYITDDQVLYEALSDAYSKGWDSYYLIGI